MAPVTVLSLIVCQLALLAAGQELGSRLGDALRRRSIATIQDGARSLDAMEESLWPTFQALPKNEHGRLDHTQVGYAAQRYFARERGWRIENMGGVFSGLGGNRMSAEGSVTAALSEAVQAYRGGRGLSAGDLALVVSVLENMMLQDPLSARYEKRVRLQRETCEARKEALERLGEPNTGRLPLRALYAGAGSAGETAISDLESPDFLRAAGAVEDNYEPQLLIANYMLLPSNCVAGSSSSSSISVCCVSPCEGIVRQLEETLQGPVASPERMFHVASGLSSSPIPLPLAKQLLSMAKGNEGNNVALHSSDFAEWLHYAFPAQCPRPMEPQAVDSDQADDAQEAVQKLRQAARVAPYTAERMIADYTASSFPAEPAMATTAEAVEVESKVEMPFSMQTAGRLAVLGMLVFAMLRTVITQWRGAGGAMRGEDMKAAKN